MRRISGIFCTRRSAGILLDGWRSVLSLEGVEVKGWDAWWMGARGPIAKTGALRGRHLFTVCRVEHTFPPPVTYISRAHIYRGCLSPKKIKRARSRKYPPRTERSRDRSVSTDHILRIMSQLIATRRSRDVRSDVLKIERAIVEFLCVG